MTTLVVGLSVALFMAGWLVGFVEGRHRGEQALVIALRALDSEAP